jgi:hypothetical protein
MSVVAVVVVAELHFFSFQKSFVVSLGGFFQNFVVQKCYRCSGWEDFSFLFLRSVKII